MQGIVNRRRTQTICLVDPTSPEGYDGTGQTRQKLSSLSDRNMDLIGINQEGASGWELKSIEFFWFSAFLLSFSGRELCVL